MKKFLVTLFFFAANFAASADSAPAIQWVKTAGGSGANSVAAATANGKGNLYIVGSTTSLDFPTVPPALPGGQSAPGGSPLAKIDLGSGNGMRLFPPGLSSLSVAAAVPGSPGILYAASNNQIWKSLDAGADWTMISQFPASASVMGLTLHPAIPTILYAGTSTIGVQKSMDGGMTWTAVNNGVPGQANSISVGSVWVDPADPNVIFAGSGFGLLRSADAGGSWGNVAVGNAYSPLVFDPFTAGGAYFGSGSDILKSTDNGASFFRISSIPNQAGVIALATDPHHPGVLYAGTTSGIYQSTDGGNSFAMRLGGVTTVLAADPNSSALYANSGTGIVKTTDGFGTVSAVGPNLPSVAQLLVSGLNLFAISRSTTDVFAMKLDNDGNIVWSTYFGGSGSDQAVALAVGSDGSLYITGSTNSVDLPGTAGAFQSKQPATSSALTGFVCKLNPGGTLAWASYFTEDSIAAIAVDSGGNPIIGGSTSGNIPTTPGAYQTKFQQTFTSNGFFSVPGPLSAFVTKFNAQGTGLIYSTYIPNDNNQNTVQAVQAIAVDAAGNAWLGTGTGNTIAPPVGIPPVIVELNPTGSALVASAVQAGLGSVAAIAFDAQSNIYIAGSLGTPSVSFPATPGAFQAAPQPIVPTLAYQAPSGGGQDAFVAKWDHSLTHLLAATLLGGESFDAAASVAVDAAGNVIIGGYTASKALPTHAPFQESFSPSSGLSGFVAGFDPNLSNLLFSTYLGDGRPFATISAAPDGNGNLLIAGSTLNSGNGFPSGSGALGSLGNLVVANKIALNPAPAVRLDFVENYASHIAAPAAPGEPIVALGAGFGSSAQIVVDGSALPSVSATDKSIVAIVPGTMATAGAHTVQVSSNGAVSNAVLVPAAATSPAIFTVDGSGVGQGYILNSDGTLNSPANPAPTGSAITIFIAGQGQYSLTNGYAELPQTPAVFIDGFYCAGIAAKVGPAAGFPAAVYQLSVYVPDPAVLARNDPDLKNFQFPAPSSIQVSLGGSGSPMTSQGGVAISVANP